MRTMAPGRIPMRRPGTPGPRGGGVFVTGLQRTRLLDAAFAVVAEDGYRRMTARSVSGRAGVSNKTFYDLFSDREDCFLAAFDHAVDEFAAVVLPAWEGEGRWDARIRAGLGALLGFLDGESALRRLVFVEALGAGPRVLERRAQILDVLQGAVDQGRAGAKAGRELPPLTAEGVVGAAFSVVHARLLERRPEPLVGLLDELMAMIVLPYLGSGAARSERTRPVPHVSQAGPAPFRPRYSNSSRPISPRTLPAEGFDLRAGRANVPDPALIPMRMTRRTALVIAGVAGNPGVSNREAAELAGVCDEGQISKLLARLERLGLLQNAGDGHARGEANAWSLTPLGLQVAQQLALNTSNGRQVA
jgi:AcrR family transcriptional regulator